MIFAVVDPGKFPVGKLKYYLSSINSIAYNRLIFTLIERISMRGILQ